ncbi:hypothetical protein JCGZ_17749 [Jatropha curcas]|uniref:non-specific serine/threonine protein kinase n=1 Tax=Jatropha curcas TaxID=180498 RepID=A0A067JRK8_JATCU|nr:hypothetical protein JCGZ_17749 [Jatropha curcas]
MAGYSNVGNYSYGSQHSHSPESFGSNDISGEASVIGGTKTHFSYEEVMEMTNGFSRKNIVGEGGFGCVYKGKVQDGREVAVKQLKIGGGQGDREFKAEIEIISRVHHKHLVSLVGYCISDNQRLLLYEFVPNKTLEHHLHCMLIFLLLLFIFSCFFQKLCSYGSLTVICANSKRNAIARVA